MRIKKTTEQFIKEAIAIHGVDRYDYSRVKYKRNDLKVKIWCNKHQVFFYQTPKEHLRGSGCILCGHDSTIKARRSNAEEFIKKAQVLNGDLYDYSNVVYKNSRTKVEIKCNKCGHIFLQQPKKHIMKRGCPYCCNSQGEKEVLRILKNNNINYQTQKTFINCKSKRRSKFDFYLPEYNLAIEYDGRQHFEKVDAWGGDSTLKQIQYRDNIKTNYCYDNDIILCRIKYNKDIYSELSEYLELRKNKDG